MNHLEFFLVARIKNGLFCRRDKRRDENYALSSQFQVMRYFVLNFRIGKVSVASYLRNFRVLNEESVSNGSIVMSSFSGREIIDFTQPIRIVNF